MNDILDFIIRTYIVCFSLSLLLLYIFRWVEKADKKEYMKWKTIILLSLLTSVILTIVSLCLYDIGVINKNLRFNF